ncbi:peptidyl-prolyl cis-trans isomerase A (cyclophilin A) [Colwellia chukchiensis]|uniref:peptidylprolyl isomerase n=1 Tax=Colwellia chukchiensis TaxID=641665 RepID=A0A1H7Q6X4_9GAMM|nr:peptidylprolyl isomerase [Colwellia chukchiensis]SEL43840.1 peptidyl-prolyl cis-trans isomerase A (cyclophilin A) [Colwellia chukchiensis]
MLRISILLLGLLMSWQLLASNTKGQYIQPNNMSPKVRVETTMGNFIIELDRYRAKITVDNFLGYVTRGQYDKTLVHRVEEGYLIQAGGFMDNYTEIEPDLPIFNESGNGLKNREGTIAMAKQLTEAHSATSQFFINLNDNSNLNPGSSWGYAVFGEVIEGYDVLEAIAQVEVGYSEQLGYSTVPKKMITIIRVVILDEEPDSEY